MFSDKTKKDDWFFFLSSTYYWTLLSTTDRIYFAHLDIFFALSWKLLVWICLILKIKTIDKKKGAKLKYTILIKFNLFYNLLILISIIVYVTQTHLSHIFVSFKLYVPLTLLCNLIYEREFWSVHWTQRVDRFYCKADKGGFAMVLQLTTERCVISVSTVKKKTCGANYTLNTYLLIINIWIPVQATKNYFWWDSTFILLPAWRLIGRKRKKEWFTVGALCYSTSNTIRILCAMVLDYGEVTILMNF